VGREGDHEVEDALCGIAGSGLVTPPRTIPHHRLMPKQRDPFPSLTPILL
jgi:hypothetical protein